MTLPSSTGKRASKRGVTSAEFHDGQKAIATELKNHSRVVLRCGRRFGKTTLLETAAVTWAYDGLKVGWFSPNYKLLLPSYKRILTALTPVVTSKSKIDMLIETKTKNGVGQVEFWTLNDEDAGRSRSYDKIIIDEGSLVATGLQEIWERAMAPTLLDRRGTAIMAGTPKGIDPENFFYQACHDPALGWKEFHAPTAANPTLDPVGVANLEKEYPHLVFLQEFLAEFVDWAGSAFFSQETLLVDGKPVATPTKSDIVFAVIDSAVKTGREADGTAVTYCSYNRFSDPCTHILDWDIVQVEGALLETWLPTVFQNLEMYAAKCGARRGSLGALIEDKSSGSILIQQAQRRGWPAHAIDSKLTAVGKDERAISVSGYVYRGMVKITDHAFDKVVNYKGQTRNHFLSQVTGFRIGVKDQSDDLLDTFTYSVAVTCGDSQGL